MRRKRIYLDTSVISYIHQEDAPEKMSDTLLFWGDVKSGKYETFISEVTIEELAACPEPKRTLLFEILQEIEYNIIKSNDEIEKLALDVIAQGILTGKSIDDCVHIASAVINNCNIIVSWNFKHLVNAKTIDGVRMISLMNNLNTVDIYSPTMMIGGNSNDE